jgi:hypothetical protein
MNTDLHLSNNRFDNRKYYLKYRENSDNNSWNLVSKAFCLNYLENDNTLYGQFLTSNWFQIPININKEYLFRIVSITNEINNNSLKYEFILTVDMIKEAINKINNDILSDITKIEMCNQHGIGTGIRTETVTFIINFRSHYTHNNKEMFLISLPEFILNLE